MQKTASSVTRNFAVMSMVILLILGLALGYVIAAKIESMMIARAKITLAGHAQQNVQNYLMPDAFSKPDYKRDKKAFEMYFSDTRTAEVVRIKVWNKEGTIVYSEKEELIGKNFADNQNFRNAMKGDIDISIKRGLKKKEHIYEKQQYRGLMEIYVPIRFNGSAEVAGVVELYHALDFIDTEISNAKKIIWSVIFSGLGILYFSLVGIVRKASNTIIKQNTELQKSEEELRHSEENLRLLFNSIQDCTCHISLDGKFLSMNQTGCILNELDSPEELVGRGCNDSIIENREEAEEALRQAAEGKAASVQYKSVNKKGREIWWDSKLYPVRDIKGNIASVLRISRNITERKKAEEERQKLFAAVSKGKKEWEAIFDSASEFIMLIDKELNIIRCNRSCADFIGINIQEATGRKCYEFFPCGRDQINYCKEALLLEGVKEAFEIKIKQHWLYVSHHAVFDDKGELLNTVVIATDITDIKNAQQSLAESTAELKKKVRELEKFYEMAVGRELKMTGLKKEIKRLNAELSQFQRDKAGQG